MNQYKTGTPRNPDLRWPVLVQAVSRHSEHSRWHLLLRRAYRAEHRRAGDGLQRPLRSRFQPRLTPGVRPQHAATRQKVPSA